MKNEDRKKEKRMKELSVLEMKEQVREDRGVVEQRLEREVKVLKEALAETHKNTQYERTRLE